MWLRFIAFPLAVLAGLLVAGVLAVGLVVVLAYPQLPSLEALTAYQPKIPLRIYTAEGILIGEFGEERRSVISIAEVPQQLKNAVIAAEDERFYEHPGIDYVGVMRAAWANLVAGGRRQGASTITMQVARNFFLSSEKTLTRKLYEALLAFKIEHSLSKEQILELYVNQIYLGQRAYGFAAASHTYYGKALNQLSLAETAMLAGLPKAPSLYNPIANPQRAKQRQQYVLRRMTELGQIDATQYEDALKAPLRTRREVTEYSVHAEFAAEMVRQALAEHYPEDVYTRGFRVYTTIRKADQEAAYDALRKGVLEYDRRAGYRGPEGYVELPATPEDDDFEDALADHPDSDDLLAAVVVSYDGKQVQAALRTGERLAIQGPGLQFAARALDAKAGAAEAHPQGRDHPRPARRKGLADPAAAGSRGGVHCPRPAGRRDPRARRRLRLQPQQVQPRHAGVAPARLVVQAVHLLGLAREGLHRGDRGVRRAGGAGSRADRQPALGAEELRRQVRGADAPAHRAGEIQEHGVDPRARRDRPQVRAGIRHALRLRCRAPPALPDDGAGRGLGDRMADGARLLGVRERRLPGTAVLHAQDRRRSRQPARACRSAARRR